MKPRAGKARCKKNTSKVINLPYFRRFLVIFSFIVGAGLLIAFLSRPRMIWYVDEDFSASWARILRDSPPPISRYEIVPRTADAPFPQGRFGFTVSRYGPEGESVEGTPVALYRDLSRTRVYDGWMTLALDPWMVFRMHRDPEPVWSFLDNSNTQGSILLAGSDHRAVQAWLCQLLQEGPGVFLADSGVWQEKGRSLVREYPFQSGAFSYSWPQVWPLVFRADAAWIYAPLSQARSLPPFRSGLLDATRFPDPPGWDRYGLQADILWAKAQGNERRTAAVAMWLRDAGTQTVIANTIEWIPAHPSGTPFNTISWETQMAWLRSSYIWQGADNAQDS